MIKRQLEQFDFHLPRWFEQRYRGREHMRHAAQIATIMAKDLAMPEVAQQLAAALLLATQRHFAEIERAWPEGKFEPVIRVVLDTDGEIYIEGQIIIGGTTIEDGRFGHLRIVFCDMERTH